MSLSIHTLPSLAYPLFSVSVIHRICYSSYPFDGLPELGAYPNGY
ncbi:hypothetical protein [Xanthocytophaga agilis]|uniref:Uncharacterized protein n=1 Tax=Xanthocytophaga agilis TaxID=3048010 RepID=A0AAE3UHS3_9BACT|nr:hypothetical protein [Xanthocytophaga agilis]MDJ1505785.1 hypothetical protein [Xanthocytophaga agilis]